MNLLSNYHPSRAIFELSDAFYDRVSPADFPLAKLRYRNTSAAMSVGLEQLTSDDWRNHFHAFNPLPRSIEHPLALRYHGHQFQSYNDRLGDGRGFLFAQLFSNDGRLLDLGTKGSGQTPWSREGDGRLTLKGAVREALATEMLEAVGVNTSKTFCFFETGEDLVRGDEPSPTRSAVLTRLGHSHIRFGTFQRLSSLNEKFAFQELTDYARRHFYPDAQNAGELFQHIVVKTAALCAAWMVNGFVHGVLNTDNMNINGESFDYGPYRFLPHYDPEFTAAYFDRQGLYAYGRQPSAVIWNLEQLAGSFHTFFSDRNTLVESLNAFSSTFNDAASALMRDRLGLIARPSNSVVDEATDDDLLLAVFHFLAQSQIPFEQFFFDWYGGRLSIDRAKESPAANFYNGEAYDALQTIFSQWPAEPVVQSRLQHPYFQRAQPCQLLIDEIEAIWSPIANRDDWFLFDAKIEAIRERGQIYGYR